MSCEDAVVEAITPADVWAALNELGKALCLILDVLPSKEVSVPIQVKDGCLLLLTISKK